MKANSIQDALNLFDPQRPLVEEDDLKAYYIARDHSPLEEMKTFLKTATYFPKLLFSGPPGCGKSTELAKLQDLLKKDFHIIMFSARDQTSTTEVNLDGMLVYILKKVADKAKDEKLPIYNDKLKNFLTRGIGWEITTEQTASAKGGSVPIEATILEETKTEGLTYESTVKYSYKKVSKPGIDAVIEMINNTVWDLEEKTKKDVLVLISDLDKLDPESVMSLLTRSALAITKLQCFAVLTFPLELKHRIDFISIYRNFNGVYFLPHFMLYDRAGAMNDKVKTKLKEIIDKRIHPRLIYDEAIDLVVKLSGGIVFELINLMRESCLVALMENINFIDDEVVTGAADRIRRFYRSIYSEEERNLLKQVQQNKKFIATDAGKKLYRQLSYTEYGSGDQTWYDVNPILVPWLEQPQIATESMNQGG